MTGKLNNGKEFILPNKNTNKLEEDVVQKRSIHEFKIKLSKCKYVEKKPGAQLQTMYVTT